MDDAQVDELRRWAISLSTDEREEVRAASKAILMLVDDLIAARNQLRLMSLAEKIGSSRRAG